MSSERWYHIRRHMQPRRSAADRYRQRRDRRRRELQRSAVLPVTVEMIADSDNLVDCFRIMLAEKGHGAGVDQIRVPDLTLPEVGLLAEEISARILTGHYRPQRSKPVRIPKDQPGTFRELSIPTVMDRVVAMALNEALTPLWEPLFSDSVWAYRPGRSTWQMLARLLDTMEQTGRAVLVIEDIASAFDRVPIKPVLACHRQLFDRLEPLQQAAAVDVARARSRLLDLVRRVLTGTEPSRQRGIPQGNNYSPTALNALLHEHLDTPIIRESKDVFWYRYSDNLTYLARDTAEGNGMLAKIRSLLDPLGMRAKGNPEDGVLDLAAGDQAHLLGFVIRQVDRQATLGLHEKAREWLREDLREAYDADDPPDTARSILAGWINAYGPAFENSEADAEDILNLAAQEGFREAATPGVVRRWIGGSKAAWQRTRETGRLANRQADTADA